MKFAVIGCQHFHIQMFIDEMLELGHEFVGIYDTSDYYLPRQYADEYRVPLFGSLEELLLQGVEIVGNAARNDEKVDVIEWAERHGIHIMTDKPIAVDYNGLNRLKKVIDRGAVKVGMMLTERFSPSVYTLKQLIDTGELGDLYDFTFLKPHKLNKDKRPRWFFEKSINGGLIIDIMIHDIDLLRWFTGASITSFNGVLVKNMLPEYPDFYSNASVNVLMEGNITGTLKADWLMPQAFDLWGDGRIFATGSRGRVEIRSAGDVLGKEGPFIMLTTSSKRTVRYDVLKVPVSLSEDFISQIQGKPHLLTAQDIYRCNEEVLKIDAAAGKLC